MYLDNEENILQNLFYELIFDRTLLYNGNSFCKKIYQCLKQVDKMVNDSGHDAEPPDFYSDKLNIMFDVARVNDSEKKKKYNPAFIAEREMQNRIEKSWIGQDISNISNNLICIDKDWDSDIIHKMKYYQKNMNRVIFEHLSSKGHSDKIKDIWLQKHPSISRKGLLIYDETGNYFQGQRIPSNLPGKWAYKYEANIKELFYKPWMDKNIMNIVCQSSCDFLIWYAPYKWDDNFTQKIDKNFPDIVILDTRYPRNDCINYDYSAFVRT